MRVLRPSETTHETARITCLENPHDEDAQPRLVASMIGRLDLGISRVDLSVVDLHDLSSSRIVSMPGLSPCCVSMLQQRKQALRGALMICCRNDSYVLPRQISSRSSSRILPTLCSTQIGKLE